MDPSVWSQLTPDILIMTMTSLTWPDKSIQNMSVTNFKICHPISLFLWLLSRDFIRSWHTDRRRWEFISNVCYELFDSRPDMSRQNASVNTSPALLPPPAYLASPWGWSDIRPWIVVAAMPCLHCLHGSMVTVVIDVMTGYLDTSK